jgi:hypothetical protein
MKMEIINRSLEREYEKVLQFNEQYTIGQQPSKYYAVNEKAGVYFVKTQNGFGFSKDGSHKIELPFNFLNEFLEIVCGQIEKGDIFDLKDFALISCDSYFEEKTKSDSVNSPDHYNQLPVEAIDIAEHYNFNRGNVVKYVMRAGFKESQGKTKEQKELEDLKKAQWYLNREIKRLENGSKDT